jgi:hypothetical protein
MGKSLLLENKIKWHWLERRQQQQIRASTELLDRLHYFRKWIAALADIFADVEIYKISAHTAFNWV